MSSTPLERLEREAVRVFGSGTAVEIDAARNRKDTPLVGLVWSADGRKVLVSAAVERSEGKSVLLRKMRERVAAFGRVLDILK